MDSFVFDSYRLDPTRRSISFTYLLNSFSFTEKLDLPEVIPDTIDTTLLEFLFFNLHLAIGISYWKLLCPSSITIKSGQLTKEQSTFWNIIYTNGLGEFYYRNKIDFQGRVSFPFVETASSLPTPLSVSSEELVGIGGGKDSLVTWELFKQKGIKAKGLVIETGKKFETVSNISAIGDIPLMHVVRTMDSQIPELSKKDGFYNGHIPISMIYAWIGVLICAVYGFKSFVASNEKSANEGNTEYLGMQINHQWSKSEEFERLFSAYVKRFVSPSLSYYSPLRQLTELQVVKEFINHPQYFPYVSSCNRNFSVSRPLEGKRWCGECAKCAFAFLLFAAYLPKDTVCTMFGKNMFADSSLVGLFRDLVGRGGMKPFDCVGTFEESQAAFAMIKKGREYENDIVMQTLSGGV